MKIQLGDFQMAYTDEGKGRPVLFVHGYPLNRRMWSPQVSGLSSQFRILAPDLRGHGDSSATPDSYSMDLFATDLVNFLNGLEIHEPVILCGLSMGGYISLAFSRLFPERLAGLVLAATRAAPDSPEAKINRLRASELVQKEGLRAIVTGMISRLFAPQTLADRPELVQEVKEIMLQTSIQGVVGDLAGMLDRPDSTPFLPDIHTPTLVIHGVDDQIVPLAEAVTMAETIPGARMVILKEAGHLLNMEQAEAFNSALYDFLFQTG
jgi:pimeloyl-ACP methyl ester carboxylesterase